MCVLSCLQFKIAFFARWANYKVEIVSELDEREGEMQIIKYTFPYPLRDSLKILSLLILSIFLNISWKMENIFI